jgi:hypothetical protein
VEKGGILGNKEVKECELWLSTVVPERMEILLE